MPGKSKLLFLLFFLGFVNAAEADVLYLKNGRHLEGMIKSEDNQGVELEVCFGSVKFERSQIDKIIHSSASELELFRRKCEQKKIDSDKQALRDKQEYDRRQKDAELSRRPKDIELSCSPEGIMVETVLNKKLTTSLILDTGASLIMLRKNITRQLGIDIYKGKEDIVFLADGRRVAAMRVTLANVRVGKAEAKNVEAWVLLEEAGDLGSAGGWLGMSFLNRFSFKVDYQNKKLTLE